MPKITRPTADFDPGALLSAALARPLGLAVTTNDPATFKRRLYVHMTREPSLRCRILQGETPQTFLIVRPEAAP